MTRSERFSGQRAAAFVNFIGGYTNNLVSAPLKQHVDTWTTVDASVSYSTGDDAPVWLRRLRFSASADNLFDASPPGEISISSGVQGLYDSQNASPLGRFVAFEVTKSF